jgi:DNA-binding HxlR family transcriptional regulator
MGRPPLPHPAPPRGTFASPVSGRKSAFSQIRRAPIVAERVRELPRPDARDALPRAARAEHPGDVAVELARPGQAELPVHADTPAFSALNYHGASSMRFAYPTCPGTGASFKKNVIEQTRFAPRPCAFRENRVPCPFPTVPHDKESAMAENTGLREYLRQRLLNGEFNCEKELTLSILSGKWKIVILWHLGHEGPHRFGELFRLFKTISNRILTKQLRELEQDGIIRRIDYDENPPRVEYLMSERGMTILPIVDLMFAWGRANMTYYADSARESQKKGGNKAKK